MHRYEDFQVHEIDIDGNVVQLTSLKVTAQDSVIVDADDVDAPNAKRARTDADGILTAEQLARCEQLLSDECSEVILDTKVSSARRYSTINIL